MTGPEYLPVSEGSEPRFCPKCYQQFEGHSGPKMLGHCPRCDVDVVVRKPRDPYLKVKMGEFEIPKLRARIAALERVAEAARDLLAAFEREMSGKEENFALRDHCRIVLADLAALGPAAPPAARSREERYREALEEIADYGTRMADCIAAGHSGSQWMGQVENMVETARAALDQGGGA